MTHAAHPGARGEHLGMPLSIADPDEANLAFFGYCAAGELRLQRCTRCDLLRYPPGTACPWCAGADFAWTPVEGRGVVYSYTEVRHAVQPAFLAHLPYLVLLVELDTQRGRPSEHEAIRIIGNLATADGTLAPPEQVREVGIGTRVRVVFAPAGARIAIPLWTIDRDAASSDAPWRYPEARS